MCLHLEMSISQLDLQGMALCVVLVEPAEAAGFVLMRRLGLLTSPEAGCLFQDSAVSASSHAKEEMCPKGVVCLQSRGGAGNVSAFPLPPWATLTFGCRVSTVLMGAPTSQDTCFFLSFLFKLEGGKPLLSGNDQRIIHKAFGGAHGPPSSFHHATGHSSVKTPHNHEVWCPGRSGEIALEIG